MQMDGCTKTRCCCSMESDAVYCLWSWAGLLQQDHSNMFIVNHCRDLISRITLWWNRSKVSADDPEWCSRSSYVSDVFCVPYTWSRNFSKSCPAPQQPFQKETGKQTGSSHHRKHGKMCENATDDFVVIMGTATEQAQCVSVHIEWHHHCPAAWQKSSIWDADDERLFVQFMDDSNSQKDR